MSIGIYTSVDSDSVLSQDGELTHPFAITFDGRVGGFKETKLYIHNDDPIYFYTNIELSLRDENSVSIINNNGFEWKLFAGDQKPSFNEWKSIPVASSITFEDLGSLGNPDISTYLPFWIFIQIPANVNVQTFTRTKFILSGNEVLA